MASSSSSSSLLLLLMVFFLASPSYSSRGNPKKAVEKIEKGFRVPITHVDSNGNYTKLELLQRGIKRGKNRLARLTPFSFSASSPSSSIQSSIHVGSGEFLIDIAIGTPPKHYQAIMDTGSDLIWTQCQPCDHCYKQKTPLFDPSKSSSFSKLPCSSNLCNALPARACDDNVCAYDYNYGDGSSTEGSMARETFTFGDNSVHNIGFGCGSYNQGQGFLQGEGLVGLGRGDLSLISQLSTNKFSYCLTSIDDAKTGSLVFGGETLIGSKNTKTTPIITNPTQPSFYYLSLQGITVGGTLLSIPKSSFALREDGSGGMIIDSGTTVTYFEESVYDIVKNGFIDEMKLEEVDAMDTVGLHTCFSLPAEGSTNVQVPKLVFHFEGADLDFPMENYIIADSDLGLICLTIEPTNAGSSIFGNVQQQNLLVLHDLEKQTISFTPTQCNQL